MEEDGKIVVPLATAVQKLDSKRKRKVNELAQLMGVPPSTVVQVAVDRLHQSKTTRGKLTDGKQ